MREGKEHLYVDQCGKSDAWKEKNVYRETASSARVLPSYHHHLLGERLGRSSTCFDVNTALAERL